jgi:nucleoside-diphosphate-sugar epimerase
LGVEAPVKILLTGATGFIGSHVARQLVREGHEVHALVRPKSDPWRIVDLKPSLRLVEGDLLSASLFPLPSSLDLCLHLAWYVEPGRYLNAPQNIDFLGASLRLAKQLAATGCKRFVAAGTCFEYNTALGMLNELTPTRPRHLYSASKLALFLALEQFCKAAGIQFAWTRFFYLYGPHEDPRRLVPAVINALLRDQPAKLTPGEQQRDFLHVEDVAGAVCAVARSNLTGAVNIGSGQPVTVADLAGKIGNLLGNPQLIKLGALAYAPDEPMCIVADNTRLCTETDWQPRFDLDAGLRQTIDWWKTHG